jgi:hypothetical protein
LSMLGPALAIADGVDLPCLRCCANRLGAKSRTK